MKLFASFVAAAALLQAGTIDVSSSHFVTVLTGESLTFDLATSSYRANAERFGLALNPTSLAFVLFTAVTESSSQFSATLGAPATSTEVTLESPISFTPATYSGAGFQGAVSSLQSQFQFDPEVSRGLFAADSVRLTLLNLGGAVQFGIAPLAFPQDFYACLSGGPLSVGAVTTSITLNTVESKFSRSSLGLSTNAVAPPSVPEPGSAWLTSSAGLVLCGFSAWISHRARARR